MGFSGHNFDYEFASVMLSRALWLGCPTDRRLENATFSALAVSTLGGALPCVSGTGAKYTKGPEALGSAWNCVAFEYKLCRAPC
jgi:hypothetical protein